MKWCAVFCSVVFSLLLSNVATAAPMRLVVSKQLRQNPTLTFSGIANAPELSAELSNFLGRCGWFDLLARGDADYQLSGHLLGNQLKLDLTMGGAPMGSWTVRCGAPPRQIAKSAVDAIIEKSFKDLKVKGFCHTKIAFCAQTAPGVRNIYLCDIDGRNVEQFTHFRTLCVEPCWNPNGRTISYSKYGRSLLEVLETTVHKPRYSRVLSRFPGINAGAAISPDQRKLALILSLKQEVDLYCMDLRTRKLRRLTYGKSVEASPCWNVDGSKLVYVSDDTGVPRLNILDFRQNKIDRLPTIGRDAVTPDWSSDGKIVYATKLNGAYTVAVYDPATKENRRVVELGGEWESPAWAADNRQVVCKRSVGNKSELYVIDTWTGKANKLISLNIPLSMPSWSRSAVR